MNRYHVQLRAAVHGDRLEGHAAVFGQLADIRGGWEAIAPSAFDDVLARDDDVIATRDHNPSMILGRTSAGTLKLGVDDDGLTFEIRRLPNTTYANDLRELIDRGDLRGASFGFLPGKDEVGTDAMARHPPPPPSIPPLLDVSVGPIPAYLGTDVTLRHRTLVPILDRRSQLILARHRVLTRQG